MMRRVIDLRKNKQYICYFEGLQEELYFNHIAKKINCLDNNITVKFKRIAKLSSIESKSTGLPKMAIFDYDLNEVEFKKKVGICKKARIVYTSLNFDLWLLLHKEPFNKSVQRNCAYIKSIRAAYNLESEDDIKTEKIQRKILQEIELEDVKKAIINAKTIMENKNEHEKIHINKKFYYYNNPSMNIHEFFFDLFKYLNIWDSISI